MQATTSPISYYFGLPNLASKAYFVCKKILPTSPRTVFITAGDLDDFTESAAGFLPAITRYLYADESLPSRLCALYELLRADGPTLLCTSYEALHAPLPSRAEFTGRLFSIKRGSTLHRQALLDRLETAGYTREEYTEIPGQYAARGSVVDIFCLHQSRPLRLYFSGNRIDHISPFDLDTQNTEGTEEEAVVIPLHFDSTPATLLDYIPDFKRVLDEPETGWDTLTPCAVCGLLPRADGIDAGLKANAPLQGHLDLADREIARLHQSGFHVYITCLNRGELDRMSDLLNDYPHARTAQLRIWPLTQGFCDPQAKIVFITSNEMLNRRYHAPRILKQAGLQHAKQVRFKELEKGDYVVHQEHGIGRYLGLEVLDAATDTPTDCLVLEYRRGSRLYVPMYDFKKVQKYISAGGKRPALATLGSTTWKDVKRRVKEEAQKTAHEILKLEALRQAVPAPEVPGDVRLEQEFADSFPYILTPGQEQAIRDTLHDLELPKPMDRVLVGDVGFGKTEVAMRAALKVALSGKQVMVVVPTTILADQHYKTFTKRLAGFPVNVRMLCRFQTPAEQRCVLQEVKSGMCDIIIGTHRLMSKDVSFKALGLVIIDEEHRFGVKQKEKIRAKSYGVHSLLLSATPIPRTLNQSLAALRDISLIDTPPRGRTPIKTVVTAWNNDLAAAAITQELARGGQIYYVYNSVQSMQARFEFLKHLVPQARICMAHGQMNEDELERTLWDFNQGKYDVLLASTIIESGIDITNANTLIVENAHQFGLAQLYQLRGRIGRGSTKAYCYLFHPDWLFKTPQAQEDNFAQLAAAHYKSSAEQDPTEEAKKRLAALMEFSDLGSGFRLALRDMEIRGAGDLLGVKQHGHVNEVGLNLYCELVANEVKKLRGEQPVRTLRAKINLPLAAYIPPDYLPDEAERLKYYKALMDADAPRTHELLNQLADLCGPVPQEIVNLTALFALSARAGALEIYQVDYADGQIELSFTSRFAAPADFVQHVFTHFGSERVSFIPAARAGGLRLTLPPSGTPLEFTQHILNFFEALQTPKK